MSDLIDHFREYEVRLNKLGCSNHGCCYRTPGGIGTTGTCRCGDRPPKSTVLNGHMYNVMNFARDMAVRIEELEGALTMIRSEAEATGVFLAYEMDMLKSLIDSVMPTPTDEEME